jgi:hypothetical protein
MGTSFRALGGEVEPVGAENYSCDLRLRPTWPPARSARIALPESESGTMPPTEWVRSESEGLRCSTDPLRTQLRQLRIQG